MNYRKEQYVTNFLLSVRKDLTILDVEEIERFRRNLCQTALVAMDRICVSWRQFDYKQCWISETFFVDDLAIQLIKSYSTIVGVVFLDYGICIERKKYSVTTSKQVSQWCNKNHLRKFQYLYDLMPKDMI